VLDGNDKAWRYPGTGDDMMAGNGSDDPHDRARRLRDAALPHLNDVYTLAQYLLRDAEPMPKMPCRNAICARCAISTRFAGQRSSLAPLNLALARALSSDVRRTYSRTRVANRSADWTALRSAFT
jgi:hypothetical protein